MKKVFTGLLIMAMSVTVYSQTKGPHLAFDKEVHDFGTIREEAGKVTIKFEFVNTGSSPLLIQNVRATCGCTAPEWTRQPVPPGGKGFVAATYNPAGRPNAFSKYLYVDANTDQGTLRLTIKGVVTPKPKTIEDEYRYEMSGLRLKANHLAFGNVNHTDRKDYSLDIINNSDAPLNLGVQRLPGHLTVEFVPAVLKPGEKGLVKATYDASEKNDWGMVIDRVNVTVNGNYERGHSLVVSANIVEDFSALTPQELANAPQVKVDAPEVNFGKLQQNEKFEHNFVLTNSGSSTLYIRKIKASCGCTAVQPEKKEIEPGESVKIKTVFNSAGKRGNQNKNVTVITNDPKHSSLILRIKGEVVTG
ncbi:MAG: DUF1573 domain-containing protein [Bacteroidales bacterium]|nr:DUF1573 domain-containing protein [Bacteroidales bacterium]